MTLSVRIGVLAAAIAPLGCGAIGHLLSSPPSGSHGPAAIEETLPNGIRVVQHERRGSQVVALELSVGVGSADEQPGEEGLAHATERLLVAGWTARHWALVQSLQSLTTHDEAVYSLVLPSSELGAGLSALAALVREPRAGRDELDREVGALVHEARRRSTDARRVLVESLLREAFRRHPYGRPVIASSQALSRLTRAQVVSFFRRWYVPSNMMLALAGDIDIADSTRRAGGAFGAIQGRSDSERPERPTEPEQTEPRVSVITEPGARSLVALGFRVPNARHPDAPALELLTAVLAQGSMARLRRLEAPTSVQRGEGRASAGPLLSRAQGALFQSRDPGLLIVTAGAPTGQADRAIGAVASEVFRLRHVGPTGTEIGRARRLLESDDAVHQDGMRALTRKLAFLSRLGLSGAGTQERESELTGPVLRAVARRTFGWSNLTAVATVPEAGKNLGDRIEKAIAAARDGQRTLHARAVRERAWGDLVHEQLPNGVRVLVQQTASSLVAIRMAALGGARGENDSTTGLSAMLARLVTRGTATRSAAEIRHDAEAMGGAIQAVSGRDSFAVLAEVLPRFVEDGLDLVADCLMQPAIPPSEIEAVRLELEREREAAQRAQAPGRQLRESLYGDHPYRLAVLGTAESIAAADRARLASMHAELVGADRIAVVVVGPVSPGAVVVRVRDLLGGVGSGGGRPAVPDMPTPTAARTVRGSWSMPLARVALGYRGARWTDPDRHVLDLIATLLDGSQGRLALALGPRGLAAGFRATNEPGIEPGHFVLEASCAPENVEAVYSALRAQMRDLGERPLGTAELERVRLTLRAARGRSVERASARAAWFALGQLAGLSLSDMMRQDEQVRAITASDVQRVARELLSESRSVLAIDLPASATEP